MPFQRLQLRDHRVVEIVRQINGPFARIVQRDQLLRGDLQNIGQLRQARLRMHQQLPIQKQIGPDLRFSQEIAFTVENGSTNRRDFFAAQMVLDGHLPVLLVLDQLNLDQVKGNDREPAGQANQYPDGAGAVWHKVSGQFVERRR